MTGENAGGATARVPQLADFFKLWQWRKFGHNIPEEAKLAWYLQQDLGVLGGGLEEPEDLPTWRIIPGLVSG